MRVLCLAITFPPRVGGIEEYLRNIVQYSSHDFDVLAPRLPGSDEYDRDLTIPTLRYPPNTPGYLQPFYFLLVGSLKRRRYDVIYFGHPWGGYISPVLRGISNVKVLIQTHGKEFVAPLTIRNSAAVLTIRAGLKFADCVLATSEWSMGELLKLGVSEERIEIVHPGVDWEFYSQETRDAPSSASPILLSVGRLVERKGFDKVIHGLPKLLHGFPDLEYRIVGEGPDRRRLEHLARRMRVTDHVRFLGACPRQELAAQYQACDVFVMPSRIVRSKHGVDVEGFGMVFLEANAAGKPTVGGNSGGVPSAVKDGETGVLVDPEDSDEIASVIGQLLRDPDLRERYGRRGREWARDHEWSRQAGRFDQVLERTCSQH